VHDAIMWLSVCSTACPSWIYRPGRDVFDSQHFISGIARHGVHVAASLEQEIGIMLRIGTDYDFLPLLRDVHSSTPHLRQACKTSMHKCVLSSNRAHLQSCCRVTCPALVLPPELFAKHEHVVLAAMKVLKLAPKLNEVVDRCRMFEHLLFDRSQ
jgi:hypothetical protein